MQISEVDFNHLMDISNRYGVLVKENTMLSQRIIDMAEATNNHHELLESRIDGLSDALETLMNALGLTVPEEFTPKSLRGLIEAKLSEPINMVAVSIS